MENDGSLSSPAYEAEQSSLANELEGNPVEISVPQDPETNPEVYRDVEPLLFKGFITIPAQINGVHFVFKSLNQHEFDLLKFSFPEGSASSDFWNLFLAYGVFMVDGVNILTKRAKYLRELASMFNDFPIKTKNLVIWNLSEINRRASNAVTLTECYAMERYSRYRWYQMMGLSTCSSAVTGIEGTEQLGLNWGQLIWRALNQIEDMNDRQEAEWEHAKFIGSCFAGKGMSKVYRQDSDRRKKAKEERFERKDKILRQILFAEKTHTVAHLGRAVLTGPKTVEDLVQQVNRDLRGEKDWHDKVVEQHENRIREGRDRQIQQFQSVAEARDREFGGKSLLGGSDMRGLTAREVQELLAKQQMDRAREYAEAESRPELHDERLQGAIDRYILNPNPRK